MEINNTNQNISRMERHFKRQQMPATDYWYSVQLEDGQILKGAFSLNDKTYTKEN
jgi:gliding motility-associated-like protein